MGQKTNPIILRIGKVCEWDSKYIEKKSSELPKQTFNNISIKCFLIKFFKDNGLKLNKLVVNQSENSLHIFIKYYVSLDPSLHKKINKKKTKFIPKRKKKKRFKKLIKGVKRYFNHYRLKRYFNYDRLKRNLKSSRLIKTLIKNEQNKLKTKRLVRVKFRKVSKLIQKYKTINSIEMHSFTRKLFAHLKMFNNNISTIYLMLEQLNKNVKRSIKKSRVKTLKNIVIKLRRYQRFNFFKEGLNVMMSVTRKKNSPALLANFIADQLGKVKRHNFFLRFIKSGLGLFTHKKLSTLKGIKIKIKGRLNGRPRARHRILKIRKAIPVQTFQSKLNYSEATSFSKNGTLGIKIWLE